MPSLVGVRSETSAEAFERQVVDLVALQKAEYAEGQAIEVAYVDVCKAEMYVNYGFFNEEINGKFECLGGAKHSEINSKQEL